VGNTSSGRSSACVIESAAGRKGSTPDDCVSAGPA
jgi:hypothetical protein